MWLPRRARHARRTRRCSWSHPPRPSQRLCRDAEKAPRRCQARPVHLDLFPVLTSCTFSIRPTGSGCACTLENVAAFGVRCRSKVSVGAYATAGTLVPSLVPTSSAAAAIRAAAAAGCCWAHAPAMPPPLPRGAGAGGGGACPVAAALGVHVLRRLCRSRVLVPLPPSCESARTRHPHLSTPLSTTTCCSSRPCRRSFAGGQRPHQHKRSLVSSNEEGGKRRRTETPSLHRLLLGVRSDSGHSLRECLVCSMPLGSRFFIALART